MRRYWIPLTALAILLVNIVLNWPLFLPGELSYRGSIEGGYVAMARFMAAHPNPWGWNPLQYGGLPERFMYVPGLPYLTALLWKLLPHSDLTHVYRVTVSLATCLGPVTAFLFALYFTRSRRWSFVAAMVYSLLSPAYGLFPAIEKDRGLVQLPWRIQILAKYGEGPHDVDLMIMPLALLALWLAGTRRQYSHLFVAAVLLALTTLVNWLGAFALTIACLVFLLCAQGEKEFRLGPVARAGVLGYVMACFWLTPSFIRTILFNWPTDAFAYQFGGPQQLLLAGLLGGAILLRLVFHWTGASFYLRFVTIATFAFGWLATGYYVFGHDTIPESRRYTVEFELFFALAAVEGIRLGKRHGNQTVRLCATLTGAALLLAGTPQLWAYLTQGWAVWSPQPRESVVEYRVSKWLEEHPAEGRVFASGGTRFRLNSWFDIPQAGGGFETGLQNRAPWDLAYNARSARDMEAGRETADTLLMLKALATNYVVIHGPNSREYYRDFVRPERIDKVLPVAYRMEDDTVYTMPTHTLADLVSRQELPGADAVQHPAKLEPYVAAMEDPGRPVLQAVWPDNNTVRIEGAIPAGRMVALRVNGDPGWRATQDGRPIEMETDGLGYMVLHAAQSPAAHIELKYQAGLEPKLMAAASLIGWAAAIAGLLRTRRRGQAGALG